MSTIRRFGRRIEFDERSRKFPIREKIVEKAPRSYTWSCYFWLDQADTPRCVGYSWAHEFGARPIVIKVSNATGDEMYVLAQDNDEWPGSNYDGSSVLGGAKGAVIKGYIKEYRWAFSEADLALAIAYKGPAVAGTYWTEGMCEPDEKGFIKPTGEIVGGHAYMINGISLKNDCYRIHNSWGRNWGIKGDCFIKRGDLATLLKDQGEACIPVVRSTGV
jgi:hypothetical protein